MKTGKPLMFKSPKESQKTIDGHFDKNDDQMYTVCELALSSGFSSRQSVYDEEYSNTIKRAKLIIEAQLEKFLLYSSKISAAGIIFNLRNNFGWKDKTENIHINYQDVNVPDRMSREEWEEQFNKLE